MTTTTTNIIRLQLSNTPCHQYQAFSSIPLTHQDPQQIKQYLQQLDNNLIYQHPYIYANNQINTDKVFIILSRGCTTEIAISYLGEIEKERVLDEVCGKILTSFRFLNCLEKRACFNPFQEKDSVMPGLSLQPVITQEFVGIAILPVNLILQSAQEISNAKMLLNYSKGRFYQRREIVRFDKNNHQIHFINGQILPQSSLKKVKLKNVTGFPLAERLGNYLQRIKDNCKQFLENWGIKFDSRFISKNSQMIASGNIIFRGVQRQLNDFIFPMARNTYNHYYRLMFKDIAFEETITAQIYVFLPQSMGKSGKTLVKDIQKVGEKMQLKLTVFRIDFDSYQKKDQLIKLVESYCRKQGPVFSFVIPVEPTKQQQDNIDFIKQELINRALHIHFIEFDPAEQGDETDIVALRNLSIIYPKERLHPWILHQIPFGDKPTIACSVNVQEILNGQCSVALVFTMNKFFSRFKSMRDICSQENVDKSIYNLLRKALETFQSKFNVIPFRIFVYRTGKNSVNAEKEFKSVKAKIGQFNAEVRNKNLCVLTYILLNKSHPFRTYTQTDQNYINYHTVKKTQLLSTMEISNKKYIQLEFDEPPMQITVLDKQNDPTFLPKLLQLTVKLCYGSVGNSFGKGMGFLEYATKLNSYRNFNLTNWDALLMEGFMLFL